MRKPAALVFALMLLGFASLPQAALAKATYSAETGILNIPNTEVVGGNAFEVNLILVDTHPVLVFELMNYVPTVTPDDPPTTYNPAGGALFIPTLEVIEADGNTYNTYNVFAQYVPETSPMQFTVSWMLSSGMNGLNCWDTNANEKCDLETEDSDQDGACSVLDCRWIPGPADLQELEGPAGIDGISCWDFNANGTCELDIEDGNRDGLCSALDCQGQEGPIGLTGPAGADGAQGPQGETGATGPAGGDNITRRDSLGNIAMCLPGEIAIAGGANCPDDAPMIASNAIFNNGRQIGWETDCFEREMYVTFVFCLEIGFVPEPRIDVIE